jgi:hypothetical protein
MTPNDRMISISFLSALSQLDESLPTNIQMKFNEIGEALLNDPGSLSRLDVLAESYHPLDLIYQTELARLDQEVGERNKGLPPLPLQVQPTAELTNMVIATLNSDDSVATGKKKETLTRIKRILQSMMGDSDE